MPICICRECTSLLVVNVLLFSWTSYSAAAHMSRGRSSIWRSLVVQIMATLPTLRPLSACLKYWRRTTAPNSACFYSSWLDHRGFLSAVSNDTNLPRRYCCSWFSVVVIKFCEYAGETPLLSSTKEVENSAIDFHKSWSKGGTWTTEERVRFWW